MDLSDFLDHVRRGEVIEAGSDLHAVMHDAAQDAFRVTAELNGAYRTPDEVRALLSRLAGVVVDRSVTLFPPFHCEFGQTCVTVVPAKVLRATGYEA